MWVILLGSAVLAVTAYVAFGGRPETPPAPDDETDDDDPSDLTDDETEDDPDEFDETEDDGPNDYDNASVYFDVNADKARKRRARVPKV